MKVKPNWEAVPRQVRFHDVRCLPMKGEMRTRYVFLLLLLRGLAGCSNGPGGTPPPPSDATPDVPKPTATLEQLKDPETCKECHARHYREWSGSMHAYAAED